MSDAQQTTIYGLTPEAIRSINLVRNKVRDELGFLPEIALVASAMLLAAAKQSNVIDEVRTYGAKMYAGAIQPVTEQQI